MHVERGIQNTDVNIKSLTKKLYRKSIIFLSINNTLMGKFLRSFPSLPLGLQIMLVKHNLPSIKCDTLKMSK